MDLKYLWRLLRTTNKFQFFLFISFTLFVISCSKFKKSKPSNSGLDNGTNVIKEIRFEKRKSVKDFDNNGEKDILYLLVDVNKSDNGNLIWDDSQNWQVLVNMNDNSRLDTLYKNNIQLGEIKIIKKENKFYIQENAPYQKRIFFIDFENLKIQEKKGLNTNTYETFMKF